MTANQQKPDRYNAREAEARWQKTWDERGIFATQNDDPRPKYYVLEMFPYPSGRIHMGHVRNYTHGRRGGALSSAPGLQRAAPDGLGRLRHAGRERRAWSARSIPRTGPTTTSPRCKTQLQSMGLSLDWAREIATCDPAYYKHQQKMFLDFLAAGLVERKQSQGELGPGRQTVLANEQVIDGRGWRSGALVEQRELTQWFLKITDYSQDLLDALDTLDRWPEKVRLMQKNWIGRSEGLLVRFALDRATAPQRRERARGLHHAAGHVVRRQVHGAVAPIIRWPQRRRRRIRSSPRSSPSAAAWAPRRRRSRPPRSWASTPASARCIRSTRAGSCRSMSPTSS